MMGIGALAMELIKVAIAANPAHSSDWQFNNRLLY
jgi:hypothetical protein